MNWLLVGASNVAQEWIISAIRAVGDEVTGIVSNDLVRAQDFACKQNIQKFSHDLKHALYDNEVDAVYISSANSLHAEQAMIALKAKKHVMCEKPMALSISDAQQMIEQAKIHQVVLAVNYHLRNSAVIQKIRELIANNCIGEVQNIRFCHAVSLPKNLQNWRIHTPSEGGVILDITVHDIDTLRFLLNDEPISVSAMAQTGVLSPNNVPETVMGTIEFAKGALVSFYDSFTAQYFQTSIDIIGSKGNLQASNTLTQHAIGELHLNNDKGCQRIPIEHHNLYVSSFQQFKSAIQNRGRPAATAYDGLRSLEIALAIQQAIENKKHISLTFGESLCF
ncbi:Gfo/Idh/MocA family oxidoreductase [Acinetobacter bereziniae]|uniref:Gfo/Idh/MocA family protein n=1 Tax=Acinetobacter bereziniae TaxID=106648 RepID=UPI0021D3745C|nr:Gfo/Idh/MocA family oxidoreductase [Acinetobacter bereziniae]MCU4315717.1 Gfo/Idh/MocA family oxidoreductase [Acinetobacter bereziniae]